LATRNTRMARGCNRPRRRAGGSADRAGDDRPRKPQNLRFSRRNRRDCRWDRGTAVMWPFSPRYRQERPQSRENAAGACHLAPLLPHAGLAGVAQGLFGSAEKGAGLVLAFELLEPGLAV